jgi:hypothetical protein
MADPPDYRRDYRKPHTTFPLLSEVAFAFAYELAQLLKREDRQDLADRVADLRIVEVARRSDPTETSFYVVPRLRVKWRGLGRRETLGLLAKRGTVNIDLIEGKIVLVSTFNRPDLAEALLEAGLRSRRRW